LIVSFLHCTAIDSFQFWHFALLWHLVLKKNTKRGGGGERFKEENTWRGGKFN